MSCGAEALLSEIPSPENEKLLAARLSAASCIYKCGRRGVGVLGGSERKQESGNEGKKPGVTPALCRRSRSSFIFGFGRIVYGIYQTYAQGCYGCKL